MHKRLLSLLICLSVLFGLHITTIIYASAIDIAAAQQQMADNSAAWFTADAAGKAALHAANEVLAADIAAAQGGAASYNVAAGTWNITNAVGAIAYASYAATQAYGSGYTVVYRQDPVKLPYSNTFLSEVIFESNQFETGAIKAYMDAGGTHEALLQAYNDAALFTAQNNTYGDEHRTKAAGREAAMVKELLGLSDAEASSLECRLTELKQQWSKATTEAERAEINKQAELIRNSYGYSANSDKYTDGDFLSIYDAIARVGGTNGYTPTPGTPTISSDEFYITVTSSAGGTVSPNGIVSVTRGNNKSFTFTPDDGYALDSVAVDGTIVSTSGNSYTMVNITSNHTLRATFKQASRFDVGFDDGTPVTDRNGNDLTARNATIKSGYGVFLHIPVDEMVNLAETPKATMKATFFKNRNAEHDLVFVSSGSSGYFELPVNSESPTGAKCAYIPVGAKDKKYDITVTVTAKGADSNSYNFTHTYTIEVKGNMYDDVQFS